METRPRILIIGQPPAPLAGWLSAVDGVVVPDAIAAVEQLLAEPFHAVLADPEVVRQVFAAQRRDEIVLDHIDKGVAVLDPTGAITWVNSAMRSLCPVEPIGRALMEALGATTLASDVPDPFSVARRGGAVSFRLYRPANVEQPYLDAAIQPVLNHAGTVDQQVVIVRNVTPEVEQQRKLDALHQAGRELADLDPDQLAEMNIPTRIELLKQNLRRYIHDLLRYDIIEVRLLDRRTGELHPLLEDGMTAVAARRVLYAREQGNGVTGYVAATGQSYLCMDTASDPLYIEGATGARSSMTVPLKYHDEVVGTLNVESPRVSGFGAEDLQFTELFSKEIATALHTLDLLNAQQSCTANQSLDLINREIAIPVDDVLASAAVLLQKIGTQDDEAAVLLRRILLGARKVKDSIRKVGRDLNVDQLLNSDHLMPLSGTRVLVVEAEERIRRSAHLLLGQLGAGDETVATATEGIALMACIPFDAVLLDNKPSDMGGYDAYRRLKAARPSVKISMTTGFGYDSAHAIVKARADGMQYVLFKPFRQDQIVKAVLETTPSALPVGNGKLA